jgi:hypothetical protein
MCRGPMPQHPPTIAAPFATQSAALSANEEGEI